MSINKTYAVFGLGRYGKAVAEELVKMALRCWELILIRILSIMPLKRFLFVSVLILQKQR